MSKLDDILNRGVPVTTDDLKQQLADATVQNGKLIRLVNEVVDYARVLEAEVEGYKQAGKDVEKVDKPSDPAVESSLDGSSLD